MNTNSMNAIPLQNKKVKKHKKTKIQKNELLNLSSKSSKKLLKAMKIAKEEANYFKKYYKLNCDDENLENNNHMYSTKFQQQFLQNILKPNKKISNRTFLINQKSPYYASSNVYSISNLPNNHNHQYLCQTNKYDVCINSNKKINNDSKLSPKSFHKKGRNQNFELNHKQNINYKNEAMANHKNLISLSDHQFNSNMSRNIYYNHNISNSNENNNCFNMCHIPHNKFNDESKYTYNLKNNLNGYYNDKTNVLNEENKLKNVQINEKIIKKNNNKDSKIINNKDLILDKLDIDEKKELDLEKLLKLQTRQYEELKKIKNYIISDSKKKNENKKKMFEEIMNESEISEDNLMSKSNYEFLNNDLTDQKITETKNKLDSNCDSDVEKSKNYTNDVMSEEFYDNGI
ncbi:hypothetical protein H8356DRAFT_1282214 [Neocallimastix lanati (nom. inval.)]|nr:hypothetical protein H8356DRAFT_1282214 [Neocallimastix sp. JGI-2020a]